MPLPLNQKTKRLSIGVAPYAVPVEFSMLTSGGNPTCTAPAAVSPLRNRRRETRKRLAITCDICPCPSPSHHRDYHFLELESRPAEVVQYASNQRPVGGRFGAPHHVAEVLLDDAFLALRAGGKHFTQLGGRVELGIRNARDLSGGVEIEL